MRISSRGSAREQVQPNRIPARILTSEVATPVTTVELLLCVPALLFLAAPLVAQEIPKLPTDFGPCPRLVEPFMQYIIQRRAAEGLNRVRPEETDPAKVVIYGGGAEDANVAWIGAAAYKYDWSRFHKNEVLRQRAFALLDALAQIKPDGDWDDKGLGAQFMLHSYAWAVLSWLETGDVDPARAQRWREMTAKIADQTMICQHFGPYRPSALGGQYANPEMYYLSGLAAAWKITGDEKYKQEAALAIRRYDDWLYPGGGMAYFCRSEPQHGYQHMIVKSVALYWDLTGDDYALEMLRRLAPYFPNVQHRSGWETDAEQPWLKHTFWNFLIPAIGVMIAAATGDGANRTAADRAVRLQADNVEERLPSFSKAGWHWYNYHLTTCDAAALRLLERHKLPEPAPLPDRMVMIDQSFQGVRSHWDDFTAAVGARQMNDSLAGAYLTDPREALAPLGAAVDGVYLEIMQNHQEAAGNRPAGYRNRFAAVEWDPTVTFTEADGFAAVSCVSQLCATYWGDMPFLGGEDGWPNQYAGWDEVQHWAVWRDYLIGFAALHCQADGGAAAGQDVARVRWRLSPQGRKLEPGERTETHWSFTYGGLAVRLERLAEQGGFAFGEGTDEPAPRASWYPILQRPAPWKAGDYAYAATVIRPAGGEGQAQVKALEHGAAAALVEPGGRKALVWVVNLTRHWQQQLMAIPAGATVRTYMRNVEMPRVPPGEKANAGLLGGQAAVWVLESPTPLTPEALLAAVSSGKGR
jgi:hypothetical protein